MKPKLYFISTKVPWPLDSGQNLRGFNMLKHFSRDFDVIFLCISDSVKYVDELKKQIGFKDCIVIKQNILQKIKSIFLGVFALTPIQVSRYKSTKFSRKLRNFNFKNHPVVFHLDRAGQYRKDINAKNTYLDMCDISSKRYLQNYKQLKFYDYKKYIFLYEYFAARSNEKKIHKKFNKIFLHSEQEVSLQNKNLNTNKFKKSSMGISNPINSNLFNPDCRNIIFLGTLDYLPNKRGIVWFINNILRHLKGYKLHIFGRIKDSDKIHLKSNNVFIHGYVKNIENLDLKFCCGISPIFSSAGIQNKVIDYISFGLPSIVTPDSIGGFSDDLNKQLAVCKNANEWKESLTSRKFLNQNLGLMKEILDKNHNWYKIYTDFKHILSDDID